jgi:hypothetical protein
LIKYIKVKNKKSLEKSLFLRFIPKPSSYGNWISERNLKFNYTLEGFGKLKGWKQTKTERDAKTEMKLLI